jgi:hypothetical protein
LLWRAAGCPGSPDDLARVHDDLLRRFEAQAALLEQYRVLLARLRDSEARLQQDLALSTAARQKLLEPLQ